MISSSKEGISLFAHLGMATGMSQHAIHPTAYARRHVAMSSGGSIVVYMSTHDTEAMQSTPDWPSCFLLRLVPSQKAMFA